TYLFQDAGKGRLGDLDAFGGQQFGQLGLAADSSRGHDFNDPSLSSHPRAHRRFTNHANRAFCACKRFSASSNTTLCGPSMTSSVISMPRCAGRQCNTQVLVLPVALSSSALTWIGQIGPTRSLPSFSLPMDVHESVASASAPSTAALGRSEEH